MPRGGVILSGCGFLDGAEIHESVLTLLALDQRGATIICCAPRKSFAVLDHVTRAVTCSLSARFVASWRTTASGRSTQPRR